MNIGFWWMNITKAGDEFQNYKYVNAKNDK
jgi:hypothetical protein